MTPEQMIQNAYWQSRYLALKDLDRRYRDDGLTINRETRDKLKHALYEAESQVLYSL